MSRRALPSVFLCVLAVLLLSPPSPGANGIESAGGLMAAGAPGGVRIRVGERDYAYRPVMAGEAAEFVVEGPAVFEPILRWRFTEPGQPADIEVEVSLDGRPVLTRIVRSRPGAAFYPDHPDWSAGSSSRITLELASGCHVVELTVTRPPEGILDVNPVVRRPDVLPWRADWQFEFGAAYDSNIFRYSDEDVEDFLDGYRQDRYDLDYADDFRLEPSVDLFFVRSEPRRRETDLKLSADWRLATLNSEKSFARLAVRLKETRTRVAYVALRYSSIPSYHIRDLWDDDERAYRSCDFRKHSARIEFGSDRSLPVDLGAFAEYDYYGYDQDFVEYDSDAATLGLVAVVRPARGLRLDAGYALRVLEARGYDELGESRVESDDSDVSYEQDEYTLRVRWEAGEFAGVPAILRLRGRMARRYYQASDPDDAYHAGREDTYWSLALESEHRLANGVTLAAFYEYRHRTAESDLVADIGSAKDYTAHRAGLRVSVGGGRFLD